MTNMEINQKEVLCFWSLVSDAFAEVNETIKLMNDNNCKIPERVLKDKEFLMDLYIRLDAAR